MKNLIKYLILGLTFINCNSQIVTDVSNFNEDDNENNGKYFKDTTNSYNNFVGTWQSTTGSITFRVTLFKNEYMQMGYPVEYHKDFICGSFQIIENADFPNEVIIHNSVKYYPQNNYTQNIVIYATSTDGTNGAGFIEDNCSSGGNDSLTGQLTMTLSGLSNSQMHWIVNRKNILPNNYFSVPIDVVLTKVD